MSADQILRSKVDGKTGPDQDRGRRKGTFKIAAVACVVIASLLYATEFMSSGMESPAKIERNKIMIVTKQNPSANRVIPTVVEAIPEKLETATFALG